MSVIRWEDPPLSRNGKWKRTADELKSRPGEWALVAEGVTVKYGNECVKRQLRRYGCDVALRSNGQGVYSVWACFNLEESCA